MIYITKTKLISEDICNSIKKTIGPKLDLKIVDFNSDQTISGYQDIIQSSNNMINQIKQENLIKESDFIISISHGIGSFITKKEKKEETIKNKLIQKRNQSIQSNQTNDIISQQQFIFLFYINIFHKNNLYGTFSNTIPIKIEYIKKSIKEKLDILDCFESLEKICGISTNELVNLTLRILLHKESS